MDLFIKILVCFIAGMGAGLGTGFAGMSAAAVITPMLTTFLDIPAYEAVGIALASDVLASAVSALTYRKHKNIDIKNGLVMMVFIILLTTVGSYVANTVPDGAMGLASIIMTLFLGLKFLIRPVDAAGSTVNSKSKKRRILESVACGIYIGFVCGFIGAGGGLMMLFALTVMLGYDLKTAVGTSVFIMTFTALTGSLSHFAIGGMPDTLTLILCIIFTLIWARIAAKIANKASNATLNRVTGIILLVLSVVVMCVEYL